MSRSRRTRETGALAQEFPRRLHCSKRDLPSDSRWTHVIADRVSASWRHNGFAKCAQSGWLLWQVHRCVRRSPSTLVDRTRIAYKAVVHLCECVLQSLDRARGAVEGGTQVVTIRQVMLALALCGIAGGASAKVLVWELHNVRFDDGGSATGFFIIDTRFPGLLRNFDITTTGGRTNPSFHYTPRSTSGAVNRLVSDGILLGQGKRNQLELAAAIPGSQDSESLLSAGTLHLSADPSREFLFPDDVFRHVLPGATIASVPEASSFAATVAGLTVLALIRLARCLSGTPRRLE